MTYLPERDPEKNGHLIAGQEYYDVEFTGGAISNVILTDVTINGVTTERTETIITDPGDYSVQPEDYVITIVKTVPEITTITFPATPTTSRSLIIKDGSGDAAVYNITIDGNGKTIDGQSTITIDTAWQAMEFIYNGTEWNILNRNIAGGDVVGPVGATDNAVARFNGTTGRQIQNSNVTISDTGNITANNFTGSSSGTNTGDQTITLTSDVTGSGTGSFATTIANNVVSDAKIRQSGALSVIGRSANSTGNVADISAAADGNVLRRSGTTLGFGAITLSSSNAVTGTLAATNGGTGQSTVTTGDILYGSASNVWSKLGIGTNGQVLGVSGGLPAWVAGGGTVTSVALTESTGIISITGSPITSSGTFATTVNVASQVQAEAGSATNVAMTPQRTNQAIKALAPILQERVSTYLTYQGISTQIPTDDTIPTNTEGDAVFNFDFTPISASSRLFVEVLLNVSCSALGNVVASLFKGSDTAASAAAAVTVVASGYLHQIKLQFDYAPGSTSLVNFKVRAGSGGAYNTHINGSASSRLFGGVNVSYMKITERLVG